MRLSKLLSNFVQKHDLVSLQKRFQLENQYTFTPNKSTLDYVLMDSSIQDSVRSFTIFPEADILTSDHLPLLFQKDQDLVNTPSIMAKSKIAWNKCTDLHLLTYRNGISEKIADCYTYHNSCAISPDEINDSLIQILHDAANKLPKSKFNKRAKPYWSNEVKTAHALAREKRRQWIDEGRPRGNEFEAYTRYKDAKRLFRLTQRQHRTAYENSVFDDLNKAAELDYRMFWKLLRRQSGKQSGNCSKLNVDGLCYSNENVIKGFHKHFSSVFSPDHKNNIDITEELNGYYTYDETGNRVNDILTKPFTEEEIGNIITALS